MSLRIVRAHQLTFEQAREMGKSWQAQGEQDFQLRCEYTEGDTQDELTFSRSGVSGCLHIDATQFILEAKLGFLLKPYAARIEKEINTNLDALLAAQREV